MSQAPDFDVAAAHRHFAVSCFNETWTLMEKAERTLADERRMEALALASLYHWLERPDCTDQHLSVGFWQASRVHALLGHAQEARRYGETCLSLSSGLAPFYRAYAYEALARAAQVAGDSEGTLSHKEMARALAASVQGEDARKLLEADLAEL